MGPDELDDLLASIRAESKRESALALYKGTRGTDLVSEKIDERVLRILGLEDVFDIDYETYISLLKEKAAAARMTGKNLATEEAELVTKEFKRVRGKVGRFKIKKQKIKASSVGAAPTKISKDKFFLIGTSSVSSSLASGGIGADFGSSVRDINEKLDELLKSIIGQNTEEKKKAELERKESEKKKRAERESSLEGAKRNVKTLKNIASKIISPFQSIIDRIFKFIKFTLLGFAFNQFINWFSDSKNKKKIEVLGRFLKDFWPSLAFAAGLFLTPLGKLVRTTLTMLRSWVPQIVKFMAAHPLVFGAVAAGAGAYAAVQMNEQKRREFKQTNPSIVLPEETAKTGKTPGVPQLQQEQILQRGLGGMFSGGGRVRRKSFFGGGAVDKIIDVNDIGFTGGGGIDNESGVKITGAGPDTQLIAAQPGEVVISKKAVDKYGANFFLGLNKNAGGTNVPRMVNNIQLAQGGGMVGGFGNFLNRLGGMGLPGTGSVMSPRYTNMGYQNKFLGLNLNRVNLPQVSGQQFSPSDVRRYNQSPSSPSTIRNWSPYDPVQVSVPKPSQSRSTSLSKPSFTQNVQTIRKAVKLQTETMRQYGYEPDGYDTFFKRHSAVMGPQSRAMPVGTPVINNKTQMIVLPPIKETAKVNSTPIKSGTDIPDFQIVANSSFRNSVAQSLGISDLV